MTDNPRSHTSASSAHADALCPGRFLAQQGLPEEQSQASQFGNEVHAAFEGQQVDLSLTQERLVELAEKREKEVLEQIGDVKWKEYREHRLWVDWRSTGFKHSGQADRLFINLEKAIAVVEDLKSLRGYVPDSSSNMQLRDLAALVFANFPINEVVVFVNQPLAKGTQRFTRYTIGELQQAFDEMTDRVRTSHDPQSKRVAGETQCKFCRARGQCPEALEWVKSYYIAPSLSPKATVAVATPQELASVFIRIPAFMSILEQVKARLMAMKPEELEALGIRKRPGHFRETIINVNELFNRLETIGITDAQMLNISSVGKGDLEELVKANTGLKGEQLSAKLKELLDGITERKQTKETLERIA